LPGETDLTGLNLFGVVGRLVAGAPSLGYSDALEGLPAQGYDRWTRAALDPFVTSPEDFASGTGMTFVGTPDRAKRAGLIACLAQTSAGSDGE
jgi:cytochrome c